MTVERSIPKVGNKNKGNTSKGGKKHKLNSCESKGGKKRKTKASVT